MELFRDTNFDFMKYRRFWIVVSFLLVLGGVYAVFGPHKLNMGIDFAGGTQVTLGFKQAPDLDRVRGVLKQAGMGAAEIQRFGDPKANQVIVKTAVTKGSEEGDMAKVVAALSRDFNQGQAAGFDLNLASSDALTDFFLKTDPDKVGGQGAQAARAHYEPMSSALVSERAKDGMFKDFSRLTRLPGVSPAALAALQPQAHFGNFAVLGVENVGPQIGGELRRQGFLAVIMSLLGMLAYIWFRFELRFGIGAVMASIHDVMVTLLFFWWIGYEFNLTTIAAFLTLIGYSMNDTVVIFDRVRENMRKSRRKPLIEVMNESINETLSRTIMTGGLTFLTVLALLILGGDVLRGFAFVMTVGIIVGTYSSVYVASPFALLWEKHFGAGGRLTNKTGSVPVARGEGGRPAASRDDATGTGEQPLPRPKPRPRQTRRRA
ncbi:MAG TPA: protein translocase subunit SecF [Thermoanaerobaculia bacterium]|jgi:preprotein translocase subunit SecF